MEHAILPGFRPGAHAPPSTDEQQTRLAPVIISSYHIANNSQ
jgi:hypothetical protein